MRKLLLVCFSLCCLLVNCGTKKIGLIPYEQHADAYTRYIPNDEGPIDFNDIANIAKDLCTKRGFVDFSGYQIDNVSKNDSFEVPFVGGTKYRDLLVWCKK